MLSDKELARAAQEVKRSTDVYRESKARGYDIRSMALGTYDSQEDFDRCRPKEKRISFQEHNEYIAEILKGLVANGVHARPVLFRYAEFSTWLDGKPITPEARSSFAAHLLSEADKKV
jgi:hypothetical protein